MPSQSQSESNKLPGGGPEADLSRDQNQLLKELRVINGTMKILGRLCPVRVNQYRIAYHKEVEDEEEEESYVYPPIEKPDSRVTA